MSIRALLLLVVFIIGLLVVLAKLTVDPWWGILALTFVLLVSDFIPARRV